MPGSLQCKLQTIVNTPYHCNVAYQIILQKSINTEGLNEPITGGAPAAKPSPVWRRPICRYEVRCGLNLYSVGEVGNRQGGEKSEGDPWLSDRSLRCVAWFASLRFFRYENVSAGYSPATQKLISCNTKLPAWVYFTFLLAGLGTRSTTWGPNFFARANQSIPAENRTTWCICFLGS
jgi:hypothetical protein